MKKCSLRLKKNFLYKTIAYKKIDEVNETSSMLNIGDIVI